MKQGLGPTRGACRPRGGLVVGANTYLEGFSSRMKRSAWIEWRLLCLVL